MKRITDGAAGAMTNHKNTNKDNIKTIRVASIIALAGNCFLALLKIMTGIFARSNALIADGVDSAADVAISIIALVVVKIIAKPADTKHPWGHGKAETIATALLSFILFFTGAQLIINSAAAFFSDKQPLIPSYIAIIAAAISIAGKIALALSQFALGKRSGSAMVKANAKNMASDVLISTGVLVGLTISVLTGFAYADAIITILIGAWIIKTAVGIFKESNLELMDGNSDIKPYRLLVEATNSVEGASNPHRARMRKVAGFWDIDLDIDVDPKCTVLEAHAIASQVEREIKLRLENVFDIMIHIEPRGLSDDTGEAFGLSEDEIEKISLSENESKSADPSAE